MALHFKIYRISKVPGPSGGVPAACIQSVHWRTLQQRVIPVSSAGITFRAFVLLIAGLTTAAGLPAPPRQASSTPVEKGSPAAAPADDPARIFQLGQDALKENRLDEAERDFRGVLQLDPQSGGAYANLGVVYMRRKQWAKALEMLHKAEHLMPQVAGIRLNLGL
ncbi:MAG: hypothetical protein DMG79_11830, partial [Acidobacteria bacterium]